ncbi:ShlB/FhaC/HecB family hemolysin secretion/activation protein [Flavobacterium sp. SLB02]|uniref:ShlB/FhaC/HecB family hemolysin secretion/activation protein n=1 Tax=Flavobacterium sp. SLB02 TaxID=2665645 RepID=UPI001ABFD014|nr:ShlB/FhaC/HecB family hemolysin secretion/activation protein [Flavobacterium sp. SLB02]
MRHLLYILIFCVGTSAYSQNFYLKITGSDKTENQIIDSVNYTTKHPNIKSLNNEPIIMSEKLSKIGFLDNKPEAITQINDSCYTSKIDLKNKIKYIHIYIGTNNSFFDSTETKNDTVILPYYEIENFLNQKIIEAEKRGFALSKIKFENIKRKNLVIYADLNFKSEKKRTVNSIILTQINLQEKNFFPKGHLKQLNKKYLNKTFNQQTVKELYDDINNFEFVTQTKYPEILLTNDSTKIYTYIEKRKANSFDGYIGFSNDENKKTTINGYLDIALINTLHAGEQFSLYWKSDGNQQKTFNTKLEIPYIFQSPLGIKAQLNIFKQDSTFQNTKTAIDLGYYINYNSKIYLGYQSTESSDIQNTNNSTISDYKNSYITSTLEYKKTDYINNLFPKKASLNFIIGYGKRDTNDNPETADLSKQFSSNFNLSYNFELNKKNFIYLNSQNLYLKSKNYITNELFRFGGINSIRGFSENSLQGNFAAILLTEYRYVVSSNLYINSILDYALYQDLTNSQNPEKIKNLTGIGIGTNIQTPNGLLRINLTNGGGKLNEIQLFNTIVNICYNVKF